SHTAILLVAASLEQNEFPGTLVGTRKEIADHRAARTHGQRLYDVARIADASVRDDGHAPSGRDARALHDRADHWHADAGHVARRAGGAGANPALPRIDAGVDERRGCLRRRHVARHEIRMRELETDLGHHVDHTL